MNTSEKRLATQALWQERIQAQSSSGKTVVQFCRESAIAVSVFYKWKSRLSDSNKAQRVRSSVGKSFIDLGSVKPQSEPSKSVVDSGLSIRIDLGAGVSLSITRI